MIGSSKNIEKIIRENALVKKKKKPGLSANRPSKNLDPGLVNLVFSRKNVFFQREHPLIDKPMIITEPTIQSTGLLGPDSKLYRSKR